MFKTSGYLVSTVSVILLAVVAWDGAKGDPALKTLLVLGALTSITGMLMRWIAFLRDEKPTALSKPDRAGPATREVPEQSHERHAPAEFAHRASRR